MCETKTTLIRRLESPGDTQAWDEFVEIYAATIFSWGKRLGLQDADAEDLTQEAFRCVVRSLPKYDRTRGRFRAWLYTIVRNEFLKWRERRQRQPAVGADSRLWREAESDQESAVWEESYQVHLLKSALERLRKRMKPVHWEIFWETEFGGKSPAEVAQARDVSVGNVYVTRSRALNQLKQIVAEIEREADELSN